MSVRVVSRDIETLPDDLLALAKSHLRVDGTYDDAFIRSVIARAIARFEATNEGTLFETEVLWKPAAAEFTNGSATTPARPVQSFEAVDSTDVDVTADYSLELKWTSIHGIPIQVLTGASASGLSVTLTCGFAGADFLPPEVTDTVLRHTAHLYEHREILIPGREYVAPDLRMDATWWMPRV